MGGRIDFNKGERDRISNTDGDATAPFVGGSVFTDEIETRKDCVVVGLEPRFAEKKYVKVFGNDLEVCFALEKRTTIPL